MMNLTQEEKQPWLSQVSRNSEYSNEAVTQFLHFFAIFLGSGAENIKSYFTKFYETYLDSRGKYFKTSNNPCSYN